MLEQFLNHIQRHNLGKTSDKILLAVSGGLDSMVMVHLFLAGGFNIGVAHCNFQLRGDDALADELMVSDLCGKLKIPFHCKRFDTKNIAQKNKQSIQVAARELRYAFFQEIISAHHYKVVATAHHLNDNIETIIFNLTRGTGIDGLKGIPVNNGFTIRPLLFASRESLYDYALSNQIMWREDSSNATDNYNRNFIRHQIIPKLKEINPNLEQTFRGTIERIAGAHEIFKQSLESIRLQLTTVKNKSIYIDKNALKKFSSPEVILWELIKDSGFNFDQCKDIVHDHQSGKTFYANTTNLIIDREYYILKFTKDLAHLSLIIKQNDSEVFSEECSLRFTRVDIENFELQKNQSIAQFDADKIQYPLAWRKWESGDSLIPLGMRSEKKISNILIDAKVPVSEKEKITVLESAGEIIWLVGMRINERFKVTKDTSRVIVVEYNILE